MTAHLVSVVIPLNGIEFSSLDEVPVEVKALAIEAVSREAAELWSSNVPPSVSILSFDGMRDRWSVSEDLPPVTAAEFTVKVEEAAAPAEHLRATLESGLPAANEQLRHRAVVDDLRAKLDHCTDELSHANRVVGSQEERIRDLLAQVGDLRLALYAESERADAAEAKLGEGPVQP